MEWGHFYADEVAPLQMYASLLNPLSLFSLSFTIPLMIVIEWRLIVRNWVNSVKTKWKKVGNIFILWNTHMHLLSVFLIFLSLSNRHQSSSSGCWPQARTEGAWWGHSSVTQPSCPESHNHPGHMDSKCILPFCIHNATIFNYHYTFSKYIIFICSARDLLLEKLSYIY